MHGMWLWTSRNAATDRDSRDAVQNTCAAVELGGEEYSLSSCKDLSSDLGSDFKVQWTVVDGVNGNTTFRLCSPSGC